MKFPSPPWLFCIGFAALLAGFLLGRWSSPALREHTEISSEIRTADPAMQAAASETASSRSARDSLGAILKETDGARRKEQLTLRIPWLTLAEVEQLLNDPSLNGPGDATFHQLLAARLADLDAETALRWAKSHPFRTPLERSAAYGAALKKIAQTDPLRALTLALETNDPRVLRATLGDAMTRWSQMNPQAALEWASRLKNNGLQGDAFRAAAEGWMLNEPEKLLAYALKLPDGPIAKAAMEALASGGGQIPRERLMETAQWLAKGGNSFDLVASFAVGAGARNPADAVELLGALPADLTRDHAIDDFARSWFQRDPAAATAWVKKFDGNAPYFRGIACNFARDWADTDPLAAIAWTQALSSPEVRNLSTARAMTQWGLKDRAAATAYLSQLGGEQQTVVLREMASAFAKTSPPETFSWVLALPDSPAREPAVRGVFDQWGANDPSAAAQALNQLPEGALKDAGIEAFAAKAIFQEPATAMEWAQTLSDSKRRLDQMKRLSSLWFQRDGDGAQAWLSAAALDPGIREELMKGAAKKR